MNSVVKIKFVIEFYNQENLLSLNSSTEFCCILTCSLQVNEIFVENNILR